MMSQSEPQDTAAEAGEPQETSPATGKSQDAAGQDHAQVEQSPEVDVDQKAAGESPETSPAADEPQRRKSSSIRQLAVLLLSLLVLAAVVFVWFTPEGRGMWMALWYSGAEKEAADALRKRGVLVTAELPDRRVTTVNFQDVEVDDENMQHVAALFRIGTINLADTKVTDKQLRHLSGLSTMTSLVLGGTPVGDAGMAHIRDLPVLASLHLPNTK
ncbi:MAG: hypothetical protein ACYSWU_18015, partial [Planctomycetota bacterium]